MNRDAPGSNPQWVRCRECDHAWIGLYLPMRLEAAARVMLRLTCPKCAATSKSLRLLMDPPEPAATSIDNPS